MAHGTRFAPGNEVARRVTRGAGRLLGLPAVAAYVELSEPGFADVMAAAAGPSVVVPLLLSTGYHVRQDLPAQAGRSPQAVAVGPPLGPDPRLARAQCARLAQAGAVPGQPVVLVAAGSRDPGAADDLAAAGRLLSRAWGAPVEVATVSGPGRRIADAVRPGDAVAPYLLSPGFFADRCREESVTAGAAVVADVLGSHPLVVELVAARARALLTAPLAA